MAGSFPIGTHTDVVLAIRKTAIGPRVSVNDKGKFLFRPFSTDVWISDNEPLCVYYTTSDSPAPSGKIAFDIVDNAGTPQGVSITMGQPQEKE